MNLASSNNAVWKLLEELMGKWKKGNISGQPKSKRTGGALVAWHITCLDRLAGEVVEEALQSLLSGDLDYQQFREWAKVRQPRRTVSADDAKPIAVQTNLK